MSRAPTKPFYRRALLKISGEAFCKPGEFGIDGAELELIAREIVQAAKLGTQLAVVVGGGNIIRGAKLAQEGYIAHATADYMGMLGTALNGLALKEMLEKLGQDARVLSALNLSAIAETFIRGRAMRHMEKGRVVIFVAGTGNPFFTTDTAAALRGMEMNVSLVLKATKVDGVYTEDPKTHADAMRYKSLTFDEAIIKNLKVMDASAISVSRENGIPILVFSLQDPGALARVLKGAGRATIIEEK